MSRLSRAGRALLIKCHAHLVLARRLVVSTLIHQLHFFVLEFTLPLGQRQLIELFDCWHSSREADEGGAIGKQGPRACWLLRPDQGIGPHNAIVQLGLELLLVRI